MPDIKPSMNVSALKTLAIQLASAHSAQDADLLFALKNADIGDDADHDGTYHQRDSNKSDEDQRDHVDDVGNGAHEHAHDV